MRTPPSPLKAFASPGVHTTPEMTLTAVWTATSTMPGGFNSLEKYLWFQSSKVEAEHQHL